MSELRGNRTFPKTERHLPHVGIIESAVACYFLPDEIRLFERLVLALQLHFRHHKASIVAVELIHFECVLAAFHQISALVDDPCFADVHQLMGLFQRYFFLKLIARQPAIVRRAFDGEKTALVTDAYPDGASVTTADVALPDMAAAFGKFSVGFAPDKELALNLHVLHETFRR